MQHLVWRFVQCLIAIAITSFQAFIWRSLMEIDCSINCFSAKLNGDLEVNHHHPGLFSDCMDHAFGNTILIVSVWRVLIVCCASSHKDISEGLIVIFSSSIVTPALLDLVSSRVYSRLKCLVGAGAGLRFLIWEQQYGCEPCVVVNE